MSQIGLGAQDSFAVPFRVEVPLTAFSITLDANPILVLEPAGTLATGTILLPASPLDGQQITIVSTQTQTALTITAAAGDTMQSTVTALVAQTPVKYGYKLSSRKWYRII